MSSLPIGFLLTVLVLFFSVGMDKWSYYFNLHSVVIVIGGTVTILLFSTPGKVLKTLGVAIASMFKPSKGVGNYWPELMLLSEGKNLSRPSDNPLINYAAGLWEAGVTPELFIVLLSQKRSEFENAFADAVQALKNLAKYPPALGMTGTVIGLVELFSKLGDESRNGLGPALALAMTATFYGLVLANGIITPIGDRLHVEYLWRKRLFTDTYQALVLINRGDSLSLVGRKEPGREAA